jgi:hypothetical protein
MNWDSDFFWEHIRIFLEDIRNIRMNWGSDFSFGRHTNELEDIRMNWGSDFHSNELGDEGFEF